MKNNKKFRNFDGQKFGSWTVVNSVGCFKKSLQYVLAKCDCNENVLHLVRLTNLLDGDSTGCTECQAQRKITRKYLGCYSEGLSWDELKKEENYWRRYKQICRKHAARFAKSGDVISFDYYKSLLQSQCLWCQETANGVDRIDNQLGYTMENSRPCCRKHNSMKGNRTLSQFLDLLTASKFNSNKL